jgi:glycosyltransferase involved in cell wall biosynthesis
VRVAYVDPHPVPGHSVEALQIVQNVDAFARTGARVDLVTPQPPVDASVDDVLGRRFHDGVHTAYVPDYRERWWAPPHSNRMFFHAARRWLRRERPDAVWVRHLRCARAILAMRDAPPVFFETHEVFARTLAEQAGAAARKVARLRALEGSVYGRVHGIIALTAALAHDLRDDYRSTTPMLIAADGVDAILAAKARPVALGGEPIILYIGSLHPWKGVDIAIAAMRDVAHGTLVVVGGDDDAIARLHTLAQQQGVAGRVRFVGAVKPSLRFDWIAAATLCVLPLSVARIATRYTSPLKLFEYLALGKPVVTTDLPSIREVVEHGKNAWLVARAEATAFADGINTVLADAALRHALGAEAHRSANARTWDARAQAIRSFIADNVAVARA